ncbi:MAG: hypothetical protein GC149_13680 [Gammaproteobacteria bacterium]|nr:hypothetical protein [Gammaproteobacteria bacterium]
MRVFFVRLFILVGLLSVLSACFGPKTPQEVAQTFWDAVIHNDTRDAVANSTLTGAKYYDGFSKDWTGYHVTWGRIVIDDNEASIETLFTSPPNSGQTDRKFMTYLVKQNDTWKVDYDHTKTAVQGGAIGELFGKLNQLGNEIGRQMDSSADKFKQEMDRLSKKLDAMADSFNKDAMQSIDKYAGEIRKKIDELKDSINRALENDKLSDKDRHVLQVASRNLEQDSERLQDPSADALTRSARNIGETQQQLDTVNTDDAARYKQEWQELLREIQTRMQKMLNELASSTHQAD